MSIIIALACHSVDEKLLNDKNLKKCDALLWQPSTYVHRLTQRRHGGSGSGGGRGLARRIRGGRCCLGLLDGRGEGVGLRWVGEIIQSSGSRAGVARGADIRPASKSLQQAPHAPDRTQNMRASRGASETHASTDRAWRRESDDCKLERGICCGSEG